MASAVANPLVRGWGDEAPLKLTMFEQYGVYFAANFQMFTEFCSIGLTSALIEYTAIGGTMRDEANAVSKLK